MDDAVNVLWVSSLCWKHPVSISSNSYNSGICDLKCLLSPCFTTVGMRGSLRKKSSSQSEIDWDPAAGAVRLQWFAAAKQSVSAWVFSSFFILFLWFLRFSAGLSVRLSSSFLGFLKKSFFSWLFSVVFSSLIPLFYLLQSTCFHHRVTSFGFNIFL